MQGGLSHGLTRLCSLTDQHTKPLNIIKTKFEKKANKKNITKLIFCWFIWLFRIKTQSIKRHLKVLKATQTRLKPDTKIGLLSVVIDLVTYFSWPWRINDLQTSIGYHPCYWHHLQSDTLRSVNIRSIFVQCQTFILDGYQATPSVYNPT